jgi:hypothetical protein
VNLALQFVVYLLAVLVFAGVAVWPLLRRQPYTPVHALGVGLALVTLVPLVAAAQAAF